MRFLILLFGCLLWAGLHLPQDGAPESKGIPRGQMRGGDALDSVFTQRVSPFGMAYIAEVSPLTLEPLGVFKSNGGRKVYTRGTPNGVSMFVWQAVVQNIVEKAKEVCDVSPDEFHQEWAEVTQDLCHEVSPSQLKELWWYLIGLEFDHEMEMWIEEVLEFHEQNPEMKPLNYVLNSIFLNPMFLLQP